MRVTTIVFLCAALNVLEVFCFVVKTNEDNLFRLDIVHYNDFHARFEETSIKYPVCITNNSECLGGFSRLYYEITELLREKPGALLLNAGDTFQGTYWYTLMKWNVTQHFINMLPNDAHAIGNHEFDDGIAGLAPYLSALKAPVVAANIDTSAEPKLDGLILPRIVLERGGRKIGIIGLITPRTAISSYTEDVVFLDPVKTTKEQAQILTDQGVDIILVLSHCGLDVDKEIAQQAGENVDIIIGGHTHSLLWNGEAPSKEVIAGPYPVLVKKDSGHTVLIVTASAFSKYVGNLTTYFDDSGELQSFEGTPIFLNRSIPEDPKINELLKPYADQLHELVKEEIAFANEDLLADSCGSKECALGNIIADALTTWTKQKLETNLTHISIGLRNSIRGSISKGVIDRGSLINVVPFTNKVVTFKLKGEYVVKTLEAAMTDYWVKKPFKGPWFPHVSGMRVTLNTTDGTAVSVLVRHDDDYQPIQLDQMYQVTTFDFIVFGGPKFKDLRDNVKDMKTIGRDETVVKEYMRKITPITGTLDHRLTVVE